MCRHASQLAIRHGRSLATTRSRSTPQLSLVVAGAGTSQGTAHDDRADVGGGIRTLARPLFRPPSASFDTTTTSPRAAWWSLSFPEPHSPVVLLTLAYRLYCQCRRNTQLRSCSLRLWMGSIPCHTAERRYREPRVRLTLTDGLLGHRQVGVTRASRGFPKHLALAHPSAFTMLLMAPWPTNLTFARIASLGETGLALAFIALIVVIVLAIVCTRCFDWASRHVPTPVMLYAVVPTPSSSETPWLPPVLNAPKVKSGPGIVWIRGDTLPAHPAIIAFFVARNFLPHGKSLDNRVVESHTTRRLGAGDHTCSRHILQFHF